LIISLLISISILVALAHFSGFSLKDLIKINPYFLVLASVIYTLTFFVRGLRFEYILKKIGFKAPTLFSSEAVAISQMINVVTPARIGDVVRAYVFKLREVPISSCVSGLAVERLFDLLAVITLSLISIVLLGNTMYLRTIFYAFIVVLLIIVLVLILSRMENLIGRMSSEVKTALNKGFPILISLSILNWMMDVLTCYIIAIPFNASFFAVMLGVAIANIIKAVPVTPGGIGTYEVAMTGVLTALGLSPSNSFTIALIDHALKNILTLIIGYVSLAHLNLKIRDLT